MTSGLIGRYCQQNCMKTGVLKTYIVVDVVYRIEEPDEYNRKEIMPISVCVLPVRVGPQSNEPMDKGKGNIRYLNLSEVTFL